jgi:hypothetical protein
MFCYPLNYCYWRINIADQPFVFTIPGYYILGLPLYRADELFEARKTGVYVKIMWLWWICTSYMILLFLHFIYVHYINWHGQNCYHVFFSFVIITVFWIYLYAYSLVSFYFWFISLIECLKFHVFLFAMAKARKLSQNVPYLFLVSMFSLTFYPHGMPRVNDDIFIIIVTPQIG